MSSIKSTRLFPARLNLLIIARWIIAVAFLGSFQVSLGQETIVKGRVIDAETGDPIPFVNVVKPICRWIPSQSLTLDTLPALNL